MSGACPICNADTTLKQSNTGHRINCPRCGEYSVSDEAVSEIEIALKMDEFGVKTYSQEASSAKWLSQKALCIEVAKKSLVKGMDTPRSIISHVLRKRTNKSELISEDFIEILKNNSLLTPAEQANNLILFLGETLSGPGDLFKVPGSNEISAIKNVCGLMGIRIGKEAPDFYFIIRSLEEEKTLNVEYTGLTYQHLAVPRNISLSFSGWKKFEELKRSVSDSRKAFMAMEFVDPDRKDRDYFFQNELFEQCLVPAVKQAGYDLSNPLSATPKAGNIHSRLEVEIRASKFIVVELSHHNNGAYWEAGFARGLGKPVMYMYNKEIGGSPRPHFDVGSDHIVFWEKKNPKEAAEELKAVIRATLFQEAKQVDN
jgi:hypothetical protein